MQKEKKKVSRSERVSAWLVAGRDAETACRGTQKKFQLADQTPTLPPTQKNRLRSIENNVMVAWRRFSRRPPFPSKWTKGVLPRPTASC